MTYKKPIVRSGLVLAIAVFAAACASTPQRVQSLDRLSSSDARHQQLLDMDVTDFYARVQTAVRVSNDCADLSYKRRASLELNERRNRLGRGSFAALFRQDDIREKSTAFQADFAAKYDGDICGGAREEVRLMTTPFSALLFSTDKFESAATSKPQQSATSSAQRQQPANEANFQSVTDSPDATVPSAPADVAVSDVEAQEKPEEVAAEKTDLPRSDQASEDSFAVQQRPKVVNEPDKAMQTAKAAATVPPSSEPFDQESFDIQQESIVSKEQSKSGQTAMVAKVAATEPKQTTAPVRPKVDESLYSDPALAPTVSYTSIDIQAYCDKPWVTRQLTNGYFEINPCLDRRYK